MSATFQQLLPAGVLPVFLPGSAQGVAPPLILLAFPSQHELGPGSSVGTVQQPERPEGPRKAG